MRVDEPFPQKKKNNGPAPHSSSKANRKLANND